MELLLHPAVYPTLQHNFNMGFHASNYDSEPLHMVVIVVHTLNRPDGEGEMPAPAEERTIWPTGLDQETESGSHGNVVRERFSLHVSHLFRLLHPCFAT
jgi:hypothetical protein